MFNFFNKIICRHKDKECLGSVMKTNGPHYLYKCKSCGRYITVPWDV